MEFIVWTEDTRGGAASADALLLAGRGVPSRRHSLNPADRRELPALAGKQLAARISRVLMPNYGALPREPEANYRDVDTVDGLVLKILAQALWVDRFQRPDPEARRRPDSRGWE
jgi:hypothetical protein